LKGKVFMLVAVREDWKEKAEVGEEGKGNRERRAWD
jgi:hypothetical protein